MIENKLKSDIRRNRGLKMQGDAHPNPTTSPPPLIGGSWHLYTMQQTSPLVTKLARMPKKGLQFRGNKNVPTAVVLITSSRSITLITLLESAKFRIFHLFNKTSSNHDWPLVFMFCDPLHRKNTFWCLEMSEMWCRQLVTQITDDGRVTPFDVIMLAFWSWKVLLLDT